MTVDVPNDDWLVTNATAIQALVHLPGIAESAEKLAQIERELYARTTQEIIDAKRSLAAQ